MFFSCRKLQLEGFRHICEKLMDSWTRLCQGSGLVSPAHLATLRFRCRGAGKVFFLGGKMGEGNSFCGFVLFNYVMFGYHSLQVPDEMTPVPKMIFVMIVHHWCSPLSNCEGGYVLTLSPMALRASFRISKSSNNRPVHCISVWVCYVGEKICGTGPHDSWPEAILSPEKTRELVWHAIQHHLPIDFSLVVALRFIHQHHQPTIVEKGKGKDMQCITSMGKMMMHSQSRTGCLMIFGATKIIPSHFF